MKFGSIVGALGWIAAATLAAPDVGHAQSQITGAGSTFAAPIYSKWGEAAAAATGWPS